MRQDRFHALMAALVALEAAGFALAHIARHASVEGGWRGPIVLVVFLLLLWWRKSRVVWVLFLVMSLAWIGGIALMVSDASASDVALTVVAASQAAILCATPVRHRLRIA
jgi:hypothetical protein